MKRNIKVTPDYIRNIIAEEKEVIAEHQRYKEMLVRESNRLRAEGYSQEQINEGLMDIVLGLGGGFIETFKEDIALALMAAIGVDPTGVLARAVANTVGNADIMSFRKYFTPGGCQELSGLIVDSLAETAIEPIADSIVATLGINPQSRLYASVREYLGREMLQGEIANGIERRISEFVCAIDVSDVFGSFRRAVGTPGNGAAIGPGRQLTIANSSVQ
tara:strand:+ start:4374 stop:5027 length:654 start_codon:yes stop_codon:yes gene_type:complete